ncbi:hypothetical protein [Enterococcus gallinarum]|uniref:hypothetical protein n=1 Tax=Enterococcus gallinarum TaxID=1353 RepID=UPI0032E49998
MSKLFQLLFLNIHTLLLFVGIAFIAISAFLYSLIVGFLVLGVCCIAISLIINKSMG